MFCKSCGAKIDDNARFCPNCGTNISRENTAEKESPAGVSDKSRLIAILLCYFLGIIGVHRFYVGRSGSGVAMIFTLGGLGIWTLIDLIMIACGEFKDAQGRVVKTWIDD